MSFLILMALATFNSTTSHDPFDEPGNDATDPLPHFADVERHCARVIGLLAILRAAASGPQQVEVFEAPRSQLRPNTYTLAITPGATRCFSCNRGLSRDSRCFQLDGATEYYICFPCNAARIVTGPQGGT